MADESLPQANHDSPAAIAPTPTVEVNSETNGEPIVQDFADKFVPKEFQPEKMQRPDSPTMSYNHISTLQMSSDDETAPPPPDLSRRGIHIPSRTSSATIPPRRRKVSSSSGPTTPESREKSLYAESVQSYDTSVSSLPRGELPPLQTKPIDEMDRLSPLAEDDPSSFDLVASTDEDWTMFSLERRSEQLFSRQHLQEIFAEPPWMYRFTSYLSKSRPQSIPLLIYYLDSLKALRAINYANAVAEALEPIQGQDFTEHPARLTVNSVLEEKADQAFDALVRDELPAYIAHVFIQYVSVSVQRRITGTLPPHLQEASEGLAEVFCLTDPSRPDNPIVFASEEFHRTTQYGVGYAIGRNCRFLQGPRTSPFSSQRLRKAIDEEREISEVFLNYRRDGSPFMNLLMIAPLFDSRGKLRYFIGAQVDVSGLVKDCTDLEALQRLLDRQEAVANGEEPEEMEKKDEFQELSEMLNSTELDIVRRFGGTMHRESVEEDDVSMIHRPHLRLREPSSELGKPSINLSARAGGKLEGIYQNYLLVRPYPSLRILFASPALRVPGMLQSPFLSRIGGSPRVRDELTAALAAGRGVTARIRWIPSTVNRRYSADASANTLHNSEEGRARWIHCTPLLGHNGTVGVWMIVLIDEDGSEPRRRFKVAPPVARDITAAMPAENRDTRSVGNEGEIERRNGNGVPGHRRHASMSGATPTGSRPGTGGTARSSGDHRGAYAEWEMKRTASPSVDGESSMRSFVLM